jgi:hypothetical protein
MGFDLFLERFVLGQLDAISTRCDPKHFYLYSAILGRQRYAKPKSFLADEALGFSFSPLTDTNLKLFVTSKVRYVNKKETCHT